MADMCIGDTAWMFCELEKSCAPAVMAGVKGDGDRDWDIGKWTAVGGAVDNAECVGGSGQVWNLWTDRASAVFGSSREETG